jgi:hypothetical protein
MPRRKQQGSRRGRGLQRQSPPRRPRNVNGAGSSTEHTIRFTDVSGEVKTTADFEFNGSTFARLKGHLRGSLQWRLIEAVGTWTPLVPTTSDKVVAVVSYKPGLNPGTSLASIIRANGTQRNAGSRVGFKLNGVPDWVGVSEGIGGVVVYTNAAATAQTSLGYIKVDFEIRVRGIGSF